MRLTIMLVVLLLLSLSIVVAEDNGMIIDYTIEDTNYNFDSGLCNVSCLNQTFQNKTYINGTNETQWVNVTLTTCETINCSTNTTTNIKEIHMVQQDYQVDPPDTNYEKPDVDGVWEKAKAKARELLGNGGNNTNETIIREKVAPVTPENPDLIMLLILVIIIILIAFVVYLQFWRQDRKATMERMKPPEERAKELLQAGYDEEYVERAYVEMLKEDESKN